MKLHSKFTITSCRCPTWAIVLEVRRWRMIRLPLVSLEDSWSTCHGKVLLSRRYPCKYVRAFGTFPYWNKVYFIKFIVCFVLEHFKSVSQNISTNLLGFSVLATIKFYNDKILKVFNLCFCSNIRILKLQKFLKNINLPNHCHRSFLVQTEL